ncbi:hypothetical protein [Rhizobium mongolense]|uniref:hypothetical protein n=1 Tax=Rhizobium mongolense TaxID=57676 RepID=UPI0034A52B83
MRTTPTIITVVADRADEGGDAAFADNDLRFVAIQMLKRDDDEAFSISLAEFACATDGDLVVNRSAVRNFNQSDYSCRPFNSDDLAFWKP